MDSECGRYWFVNGSYRWKFKQIFKNQVSQGKISWVRGNTWANAQATLVCLKFNFDLHIGLLLNFQSEISSKFNVSHAFGSKTQEINSMKPFSFNIVFQQYKEHASICLNNFNFYFNDEIVQSLITIAHRSKHYEITLVHPYLSKGFPILPRLVPRDVVWKVSMWQNRTCHHGNIGPTPL